GRSGSANSRRSAGGGRRRRGRRRWRRWSPPRSRSGGAPGGRRGACTWAGRPTRRPPPWAPQALGRSSGRRWAKPPRPSAGPGVVTLSARLVELGEADCQELLGGAGPGPHLEVTVADTGGGLSPEARRRLFHEVFFSTKPRHRGLGLAQVYGLLQGCRGGLR